MISGLIILLSKKHSSFQRRNHAEVLLQSDGGIVTILQHDEFTRSRRHRMSDAGEPSFRNGLWLPAQNLS
jgi:hypothetical protein